MGRASRAASTEVMLSLRALQLRETQPIISNLDIFQNSKPIERKHSDASRKSSVSTVVTHPSPPQTPKTNPEWDDAVQLDAVPWRPPVKRQHGFSAEGSMALSLPNIDDLLKHHWKHGNRASSPPSRWATPSASPEPPATEEHTFSTSMPAVIQSDDLITRSLNAWRDKRLCPLPRLWLLDGRPASFDERRTFFQGKRRESRSRHDPLHKRPRLPLSPRSQRVRKPRSNPDEPHLNVKYMTEELDFIRYHRCDRPSKWDELTVSYNAKFHLRRRRLGVQGGLYRQNDGQVPHLVDNGRRLDFLPNGHVTPSKTKIRKQKDKRLFGLVALFPERAMHYSWVDPESRQEAAKLAKEREIQKEQAKQEAIRRGTWVEKPEEGTCACCFKEDRESSKRAAGTSDDQNTQGTNSLNFAIAYEL
ncbi:hypothetical protein DL764_004267 [Monosporascus ibericus]|uniref:Uncharacterized protein n=1 Tax=Monosporascus ibericus TaxID=155417 RepID=A0A4Q4TGT9_9PEZI|nr:hypothetical protein DL764_004267 [Monosporascus ibericus]